MTDHDRQAVVDAEQLLMHNLACSKDPAWVEEDDATLSCAHCGYCKPFEEDVDPDTVTWLPEQYTGGDWDPTP